MDEYTDTSQSFGHDGLTAAFAADRRRTAAAAASPWWYSAGAAVVCGAIIASPLGGYLSVIMIAALGTMALAGIEYSRQRSSGFGFTLPAGARSIVLLAVLSLVFLGLFLAAVWFTATGQPFSVAVAAIAGAAVIVLGTWGYGKVVAKEIVGGR